MPIFFVFIPIAVYSSTSSCKGIFNKTAPVTSYIQQYIYDMVRWIRKTSSKRWLGRSSPVYNKKSDSAKSIVVSCEYLVLVK